MTDFIILTYSRHGSSYTVKLMQNFKNLSSYDELLTPKYYNYDVSKNKERGINFLKDKYDINMSCDSLTELQKNNPRKLFNILRRESHKEGRYLSVKVLFKQWPKDNSLLLIKNIKPIFLIRKPIDAFISKKKVDILNKWHFVDTTNIQLNLNSDEFINYYKSCECKFYEHMNLFNEYCILDYDKELKNNEKQGLDIIRSKIYKKWNIDLIPKSQIKVNLPKQDKNITYEDTVKNLCEFLEEIKEKGFYDNLWNYTL